MKKKTLGILIGLSLMVTIVPYANVAHAGIVPDCGQVTKSGEVDATGKPIFRDSSDRIVQTGGTQKIISTMGKPCDFNYLMQLINRIVNFLLITLATPLIAVILMYAGFKLITSGGSSEARSKAKKIILNAIFGYIIALAAWLIVHTIMSTLGVDECMTWLGKEIPECEVTK